MKEITITAKLKINPDKEQALLLIDTKQAYTDACDYVSSFIYENKIFTQTVLHKNLYKTLREKYKLKSQMAESVIKTVLVKYKTLKSNNHDFVKIKFKKKQYDLVWNRDYSLTNNKFSINTLSGRIKVDFYSAKMEKYFSKDYKFGTATLAYKNKKFFLHIPVTFKVEDTSNYTNVIGVDRGINFITATYDNNGKSTFVNGKQIKQRRAHYKKLRSELQSVGTPSSRRRLKSIGNRENRWMQDVNHQVSKALVTQNPNTLFVLEDLSDIRLQLERVRLRNRYVSVSWSYADLAFKIAYKSQLHKSNVIYVDPSYTSQTCPMCGYIDKSNRNKKMHVFTCKNCNYISNDDRIGAMNLYLKGINYLELTDTVADEHDSSARVSVNAPYATSRKSHRIKSRSSKRTTG